VSPDDRDIIFTSNRTGNNDIYVVGSRGGAPVNLTNNSANDGWARWQWSVHGGVEMQALGETTKVFNGGDGSTVSATFGFGWRK
jgi:hypothetical protein